VSGVAINSSSILNEHNVTNQAIKSLAIADTTGQVIGMLEFNSFLSK